MFLILILVNSILFYFFIATEISAETLKYSIRIHFDWTYKAVMTDSLLSAERDRKRTLARES